MRKQIRHTCLISKRGSDRLLIYCVNGLRESSCVPSQRYDEKCTDLT